MPSTMAMMDDAAFLISHIRNSFITSDDTGMCEVVLEAEEAIDRPHSGTEKRPTTWHGINIDRSKSVGDQSVEADCELPHSYDIPADIDFAGHRRRSNTAKRLEKLKWEKHKQSKIKHIQWKQVECNVDEIGEYFEKREIVPQAATGHKKSALTLQLEESSLVPNNPFMEYSKFDGRSGGGMATKKIDIFLTMAPKDERVFPMIVVTLSTAKVLDLIGLICWQYTNEKRQPPLQKHIGAFSLHIAEDDGEVDMDFPALDNKEPISKFGFSKLALVEKEINHRPDFSKKVVSIDLQHRGIYEMPVESESILVKDILAHVLEKYNLKQRPGLEYHLEKKEKFGVCVDPSQTLGATETKVFCLIRENSARLHSGSKPQADSSDPLDSSRYKSYVVSLIHKLRTNKDVQLGVSGDKIEIDPLSGKGLFKVKPKPLTLDIDDIAACTLLDNKSSGKVAFRLAYHAGHEFKHQDFECDAAMASEITRKINNIMDMRSSPVRKDYKNRKERKHKH